MQTPLNASASTAGVLLSSSTFEVPKFQREYSWQSDEVADFWNDLRNNIDSETYFLGLIILTDQDGRKHVVDGQQRILTLSLLANAIYHEALSRGRRALADRIQADFLHSIDYDSDKTAPRVVLSDNADNATFQELLATGEPPADEYDNESVSERLINSYAYLRERLRDDLKADPFKRLGKWTEFLTHRVYFAVFVHPDSSTAYQVYEVINTRGKELTTADLLKNYLINEATPARRDIRYRKWQAISSQFAGDGANTFVQYIRHVVTVESGHVLPRDLFGFLAGRIKHAGKPPPTPNELMKLLEERLPLYLQMIDPSFAGPAEAEELKIFSALNSLGVIAVRPILLAVADLPNSLDGMKYILRLVVRRIVVGNLGTGNVERRFGEAARNIRQSKSWKILANDLQDLNPEQDAFIEQLRKRSFNKGTLAFLRRSILARSITPEIDGVLHMIWTPQASAWESMGEEDGAFWRSTIGNTFLSKSNRRPKSANDWEGFKEFILETAIPGEWLTRFKKVEQWDETEVANVGLELAKVAGKTWYQ